MNDLGDVFPWVFWRCLLGYFCRE